MFERQICLSFFCILDSHKQRVSRSLLSAHLSLLQLVSSTFLLKLLFFFSEFFNEVPLLFWHLRIDSPILTEISFLHVLGVKGLQNRAFVFFLEYFIVSFSWKQSKWRMIVIVDFPSQISWLATFWVLNLCPRCFQLFRLQDSWKSNISRMSWGIVDFLYLNNISIRLGLTRLCMPKVLRNYKSGIHSGEIYKLHYFNI